MTMRHFALCVLGTLSLLALSACTTPPPTEPQTATWRGLMIDTSRHFIPVDEVITILDQMVKLDLNRLHLHLTDGPGWRFESTHYPLLTQKGAWRVDKTDKPWNWRATTFWQDSIHAPQGLKKYGGYYTKADLIRIRKEAELRHILVVPEIDVPGHSAALMFAYPELACPTNQDPALWFRGQDVICIGNPKTLPMLDTLIGELCEIFPHSPIHVGCDEVPKQAWSKCPLCKSSATQRAFYNALLASVTRRGHEVIAWDELRHTGIDLDKSGVSLMCWHDDVVPRDQDISCPYSYCYLDQPFNPTAKVQLAKRGYQFNLWTEEMATPAKRLAPLRTIPARKAVVAR